MKAKKYTRLMTALTGLLLLVFTNACSRSGSSSGSAGSAPAAFGGGFGYGQGGCGNCAGADEYVLTALGQAGDRYLQIGLDIFLDPSVMTTADGSLMSMFQLYPAGAPVGASGEMEVRYDYSSCRIDPGVYRLYTAQAGTYRGFNQFSNMVLEGENLWTGLRVTVALNAASNNFITYLSQPSFSFNRIPYNYKIQQTMTIVSAEGYPCTNGVYELF